MGASHWCSAVDLAVVCDEAWHPSCLETARLCERLYRGYRDVKQPEYIP